MYYWKWPNTGVGNDWVTYSYRWRSGWDSQPLDTDPGIPSNYGGRLRYDSVSDMLEMNGYWDNSIYESAQGITDTMTYTLALAALWSRMTPATKTPSADFGATTYDWSIIQDDHTDPPDAGDAEVAKLNAHVAIAVSTTFGLHGSQTNFGNAVAGLEDHFRYDPDALWTNPAHEADIDSLIEEIQWLRPAGLGGSKPPEVGGGHAWVVSAYNKGTDPWELWMNMGWEGRQDGWYSWDTMPFSHTNDMMTLVAPLDVVKFVGADNRGDGSPDDPYEDIEEAIANAPDGATLIFKAGSDNTFSAATLIINRPFTLKGKEVTVHEE